MDHLRVAKQLLVRALAINDRDLIVEAIDLLKMSEDNFALTYAILHVETGPDGA